MSAWLFILAVVVFVVHLEVKCREQERENDAQKLKGCDDDAS